MDLLKLRATASHPTFQKVERLISLLENTQLELEWVEGSLKIRDVEHCVTFDLVREDDGGSQGDLPPTFLYKLVRDKIPNKNCKCQYCNPNDFLVDK